MHMFNSKHSIIQLTDKSRPNTAHKSAHLDRAKSPNAIDIPQMTMEEATEAENAERQRTERQAAAAVVSNTYITQ